MPQLSLCTLASGTEFPILLMSWRILVRAFSIKPHRNKLCVSPHPTPCQVPTVSVHITHPGCQHLRDVSPVGFLHPPGCRIALPLTFQFVPLLLKPFLISSFQETEIPDKGSHVLFQEKRYQKDIFKNQARLCFFFWKLSVLFINPLTWMDRTFLRCQILQIVIFVLAIHPLLVP